jgi:hypothetical protein
VLSLVRLCVSCSEDMRAEFAAAAEARKRAGEEEEGGPAKRSKAEPLGDEVLAVLNEVRPARGHCSPSACSNI